jgi:hypothetical protein
VAHYWVAVPRGLHPLRPNNLLIRMTTRSRYVLRSDVMYRLMTAPEVAAYDASLRHEAGGEEEVRGSAAMPAPAPCAPCCPLDAQTWNVCALLHCAEFSGAVAWLPLRGGGVGGCGPDEGAAVAAAAAAACDHTSPTSTASPG